MTFACSSMFHMFYSKILKQKRASVRRRLSPCSLVGLATTVRRRMGLQRSPWGPCLPGIKYRVVATRTFQSVASASSHDSFSRPTFIFSVTNIMLATDFQENNLIRRYHFIYRWTSSQFAKTNTEYNLMGSIQRLLLRIQKLLNGSFSGKRKEECYLLRHEETRQNQIFVDYVKINQRVWHRNA